MLAELRDAALFYGGAGAGLLPRLAAERLERGPRRAGALEDVLLLLRELLGALAPLEDVFGAEVAALGEVGDVLLVGEELEQRLLLGDLLTPRPRRERRGVKQKGCERRSLLGGDGGRAHIIDRLYINRGLSTPSLNKSDDPTVLFLMIGVMIGVGLLMFFRTSTDMDHVANPDALLKALDGPVVKYVR